MNKIRLLLTLCALSTISSLQSAASSALMKAMEYTRAASIKPLDIQVVPGASGNKLITISRNSNDIVTFDSKLLADHDFSGAIQEFKGIDEVFMGSAHQLFENLNDHQINVLVKALNEDIDSASAKNFVDNLNEEDLGWLANKANFAEINNIYETLTTKIGNNPELVQALYNEHKINDDVSEIVNDKFNMRFIDNAIFNRVPYSSCHSIIDNGNSTSTTFNTDNSKVLIAREWEVILVDLNTNQQTILYTRDPELDGNSISSAIFNADSSKLLIATWKRVLLVDLHTNQQLVLYTQNPQLDGEIGSAVFNTDNSKVLIATGNRVVLVDTQNPNQQTILYTRNFQLDGLWIMSTIFNADSSKVLIGTQERAILVDALNPNQQTTLYTINHPLDHSIKSESARFNADNDKILITTWHRVILVDLNTNQQTTLYTKDPQQDGDRIESAVFNADSNQVLIPTSKRVILIDLNTNQKTTLYTRNKRLASIVSAIFSADNSKVFVATWYKGILCKIGYLNVLKRLDLLSQKLFLFNASKMWEQNKPYIIKSDEELEIYNSLPSELKKPELFEIALEPKKDIPCKK